jgi:hypothetical protein
MDLSSATTAHTAAAPAVTKLKIWLFLQATKPSAQLAFVAEIANGRSRTLDTRGLHKEYSV